MINSSTLSRFFVARFFEKKVYPSHLDLFKSHHLRFATLSPSSEGILNQTKKSKFTDIYLSPVEFYNFDSFVEKLSILNASHRYSILFRVCYGSHPSYKMLGNQIGLNYDNLEDINLIHQNLHDNLLLRLESSMMNYNFTGDDIITIQILAYKVEFTNTVQKAPKLDLTTKNLGENRDLINNSISKIDLTLGKVLPPTMNLGDYGSRLETVSEENGNIKSVLHKDRWIDLATLIVDNNSEKNKVVLSENTQILSNHEKYLVSVQSPTPKHHDINVFTVDGRHVLGVTDKEITNTIFTRTTSNITKTINTQNSIVSTSIKVGLDPIKIPKSIYAHLHLIIPDPRIGTLDIETYMFDGISKVYGLGFYTKQHGVETFYLNKELNSSELVLKCIDSMLIAKYSGLTFYVHNLGRYDIVFILKILIAANKSATNEKYKLEIFTKDDLILSLTIKANNYSIKLVDSYNILSYSLKDLGKTFDLNIQKDIFPYQFVNKNTIFYTGNKPHKSFYTNDVDQETYNLIPNTWDTKIETIKYLEKDLKSLFEVMAKFSDYIYRNYKVQVSGSLTISSLSMKIFLSKFYKKDIPLVNKRSVYEDIKKSYFGGITEVYKPYGENLYYYDVNSLYPYAALNPMPGTTCVFEDTINNPLKDVTNFFGFYYCSIKTNYNYLGLLPVRSKQGIIMPNGEWSGWYFSEELKFASLNGYEIFVHKGYTFNKTSGVFDNYIKHFYNIKATTNDPVEKAISKSLLNNLLGRFGLSIHKSNTELMDTHSDKYNAIMQTKAINSQKSIGHKSLVNYTNKVYKTICDELAVDYKGAVLHNLKTNNESEKTW